MLRHAARYADIWNSLSFRPTFAEQLAETRSRIAAIESACAAVGRDPATLRRSYTMFDPQARSRGGAFSYFESAERFLEQVSRVVELGISDVGLYYPLDPGQRVTFETIASELLPELRAAYPAI
jgi:alkanesulfonate monooxygenase SsuD/methylene tetrahydromethanopterin reductase-like flavin-dependent oxidoreductase (luciferase family)